MSNLATIAFGEDGSLKRVRNRLAQDLSIDEPVTDAEAAAVQEALGIGETVSQLAVTATGSTSPRLLANRFKEQFNVLDYGADPTGVADCAAAINAAIVACNGAGGGIVNFPPGSYKILSQIQPLDKVRLRGPGSQAATIDCTGFSDSGGAVRASGSLTLITTGGVAVAEDIDKGDQTITFSEDVSATLAAGDIIIVEDDNDNSWSSQQSYYHAGEYFEVHSVDGAVVTTTAKAFASYSMGANLKVFKMTPVRVGISGLKFRFKPGPVNHSGIVLKYGAYSTFEDVEGTGSLHAQLYLDHCFEAGVQYCRLWDYQEPSSGNSYGGLFNGQRISVNGGFYKTSRHGIATGGSPGDASIVNREISYTCLYAGTTGSLFALDVHGNAEHVLISGCIIDGGMDFGGDYINVINNQIRSGEGGIAISAKPSGFNCAIKENTFTANSTITSGFGLIYILREEYLSGNGVFDVSGNTIRMGAWGPTTGLSCSVIYVAAQGAGGSEDVGVSIHDNLITTEYEPELPSAFAYYGINVRVSATKSLARLTITDNELHGCGIQWYENIGEVIIDGSNKIFDALDRGMFCQGLTEPSLTSQVHLVEGAKVFRARNTGISFSTGTEVTLSVKNCRSINNGLYASSTAEDCSLYIANCAEATVEDNTFGDTSATPTQQRRWTVVAAGKLIHRNNRNVGAGVNSLAEVLSATAFEQGDTRIKTISAAYTATRNDDTLLCDTSGGGFTLGLTAAASMKDKVLTIKKISSDGNTALINPSGAETVDGAATKSLSAQWDSVRIQCNGTAWFLI